VFEVFSAVSIEGQLAEQLKLTVRWLVAPEAALPRAANAGQPSASRSSTPSLHPTTTTTTTPTESPASASSTPASVATPPAYRNASASMPVFPRVRGPVSQASGIASSTKSNSSASSTNNSFLPEADGEVEAPSVPRSTCTINFRVEYNGPLFHCTCVALARSRTLADALLSLLLFVCLSRFVATIESFVSAIAYETFIMWLDLAMEQISSATSSSLASLSSSMSSTATLQDVMRPSGVATTPARNEEARAAIVPSTPSTTSASQAQKSLLARAAAASAASPSTDDDDSSSSQMYVSAEENTDDDDSGFFDAEDSYVADALRSASTTTSTSTSASSSNTGGTSSQQQQQQLSPDLVRCLQVLDEEVKQLRGLMEREQMQVNQLENCVQDMTQKQGSVIERLALRYEENARQTYATYVRRLNQLLNRAQGDDDDTSATSKKIATIEHRLSLLETQVATQEEELRQAQQSQRVERSLMAASAIALTLAAVFVYFRFKQGD